MRNKHNNPMARVGGLRQTFGKAANPDKAHEKRPIVTKAYLNELKRQRAIKPPQPALKPSAPLRAEVDRQVYKKNEREIGVVEKRLYRTKLRDDFKRTQKQKDRETLER